MALLLFPLSFLSFSSSSHLLPLTAEDLGPLLALLCRWIASRPGSRFREWDCLLYMQTWISSVDQVGAPEWAASARGQKDRLWGSVQLNIRCLSEVLSRSSKTIYLSKVEGSEPFRNEICEVVLGRVDVSFFSLTHHCLSSGWAAVSGLF